MSNETIVPRKGSEKSVFLFGALIMVAGIGFALGLLSSRRADADIIPYVGYMLILLALGVFFWGYKLWAQDRKGIFLSPTGYYDPQLMKSEIPWAEVTDIALAKNGASDVLYVRATREGVKTARLNILAKLLHGVNGSPGVGYRKFHFDGPLMDVGSKINNARVAALES